MPENLSVAYSPCPNDTFIFYALVHNKIDTPGLNCQPCLADVETLNQYALKHRFDVTKLSYHALGFLLDEYCLLPSGSALGQGCGPIVVAKENLKSLRGVTIAIPGELTTAHLLLQLFEPGVKNVTIMPFEKIMPAVAGGRVDAGVIIHESRFTYPLYNLRQVVDLGEWWEEETGTLIPLGCIAAKRSLGRDTIGGLARGLHSSVKYAQDNPGEAMPYIKKYAREMDEGVINSHINLYVNKYTLDLGSKGIDAVNTLFNLARGAKILPETDKPLFIEGL